MSKRRPRTGLAEPRRIERELREARWREKGAALGAGSDKAAANLQAQAKAASVAWGVDLSAVEIPKQNELAELLLIAKAATGKNIFAEAFEELRRLGLTGPDGIDKLHEMLPPSDAERGLDVFLQSYPGSREAAMEAAAVAFEVPASSFDGAVKSLKRTWTKKRPKLSER